MKKLVGLNLIKAYDEHPENYLPMVIHNRQVPRTDEYGEINIGWYAGLLDENRPFFAECWATDGITMLTLFISTLGIEDESSEELEQRFLDIGYYRKKEGSYKSPSVRKFDQDGHEFYSINIIVGVDEEPAMIEGAYIIPWNVLNEYNISCRHNN